MKISVYRSHIALDFSNLPPHNRPGGSTRGNPDRKTRNLHARDPEFLFFFGFRRGGGQRCIERAPGTDQSTHLEDTMAGEKIR